MIKAFIHLLPLPGMYSPWKIFSSNSELIISKKKICIYIFFSGEVALVPNSSKYSLKIEQDNPNDTSQLKTMSAKCF